MIEKYRNTEIQKYRNMSAKEAAVNRIMLTTSYHSYHTWNTELEFPYNAFILGEYFDY